MDKAGALDLTAYVRQPDAFYFFIIAVSAFFALLIAALVIGFGVKYHRRHAGAVGARIEDNLRLELLWSVIPTVMAMVIFGWGASVCYHLGRPPEKAMATGPAATGATGAVPSSGATDAPGPVRQRQ